MDDDELIRAAREGREYAGPFLVSLYSQALLGHARSLAGDLGDIACEQICEWAVERAIRRIELFDPSRGTFLTWARSMLRFAALDYRRDHDRLRCIDGFDPADCPVEPVRDLPEEVRSALTESVRRLRPADQAILALRDGEGLPAQAVASRLQISPEAVRQRHSRARRRLASFAKDNTLLLDFVKGLST